jgi:cysteine desulfurase
MTDPVRAYLDWNASAPLRPAAREALLQALQEFGNPSSPHREGQRARALLEASRSEVAAFLGCDPVEVVFTSGGTEANNLALYLLGRVAGDRSFACSGIEHASVLGPLERLAEQGWQGRWLPVGEDGRVDASASGQTPPGFGVLQAANQETGALQPVDVAAELWGATGVPWHCDAVQTWGRVPLSVAQAGCATASLSGHKLGGPKGVGALFVRRDVARGAQMLGGPQEHGCRAGTENLPGIAALDDA